MALERREVTIEYIDFISRNMRIGDQVECAVGAALLPKEAIEKSLSMSNETGVLYDTDMNEPVIVFGLCDNGVIWALGTEGIRRNARDFIALSTQILDEWNDIHEKLWNYVYSGNTVHINWLKRSGCDILESIKTGPVNADFYRFERIRKNV